MAGPGSSADLFAMLGGLNDSGQILTLLCSDAGLGQTDGFNSSSLLERHDGPPPALAGGGVQLFRIIFDLYVVGLICLVGFIG